MLNRLLLIEIPFPLERFVMNNSTKFNGVKKLFVRNNFNERISSLIENSFPWKRSFWQVSSSCSCSCSSLR